MPHPLPLHCPPSRPQVLMIIFNAVWLIVVLSWDATAPKKGDKNTPAAPITGAVTGTEGVQVSVRT